MPTYDYQCRECGHKFEAFQHITEDPLKECPECGGQVKRLIGAGAGLIFKGSGFYITDYKKKGGASNAGTDRSPDKKESKPSSNGAASAGKKTDAKSKND